MQRLERAIRRRGNQAPVVPGLWPSLSARQIAIRRGEVSMVAGAPGAGKSTFAAALAVRAQVGTLYISADTHSHTMALRLLSMLSGAEQAQVEQWMTTNPEWVTSTLAGAQHIRWCFDSAPSIKTIEEELAAYEELNGTTPDLLVIDNLIDCVGGEGDEWGQLRSLLKDTKWLARDSDVAVLVLHHTSEGFDISGAACPPRKALQGKVAQTPALVLTVANHDTGSMYVCPVKSRYSAASPSGTDVTRLIYRPESMFIADPGEGR